QAASGVYRRDLLHEAPVIETEHPALPAPSEGQTVVADYESLGLSLRRHPLSLLRAELAERRFEPASVLNTYPDRRLARACGIVTVRQRPQTAKGTIFVTIEDETGPVNVVVRKELMERQRRELLSAVLLGVYGTWQNIDNVRNLVAQRLVDLSPLLRRLDEDGLSARSRDFH
ncbi:OB-fold nucleic acid binding domain-containing protein, partial [Bordetella avium]